MPLNRASGKFSGGRSSSRARGQETSGCQLQTRTCRRGRGGCAELGAGSAYRPAGPQAAESRPGRTDQNRRIGGVLGGPALWAPHRTSHVWRDPASGTKDRGWSRGPGPRAPGCKSGGQGEGRLDSLPEAARSRWVPLAAVNPAAGVALEQRSPAQEGGLGPECDGGQPSESAPSLTARTGCGTPCSHSPIQPSDDPTSPRPGSSPADGTQ